MSKVGPGEFIATVGVFLTLGAGIGLAVESRSDEVARGKAITAKTCLDIYPNSDASVLTQNARDCMDNNWPNARKVDPDRFANDSPVQLVESYIAQQHSEANHINWEKLMDWSLPLGGFALWAIHVEESDNPGSRNRDESNPPPEVSPAPTG